MTWQVIYSDVPWMYKSKKTGGSMISGSAQKYPVMDLDDIKVLDIKSLCSEKTLLFEWVPVPLIPEAVDVIRAWGFKYNTAIFWRKIMSQGLGYWFRGQVELLFLCTLRSPPAFRCQKANYIDTTEEKFISLIEGASCGFIQSKVGKHSKKPEQARQLIEEALKAYANPGKISKLELFATSPRDAGESSAPPDHLAAQPTESLSP